MLKHYLTTALRNFRRHKTTTLINVFGLALGLACFIAAIGVLTYIRNADRHLPNADRIVMVLQRFTDLGAGVHGPMQAATSAALALSMRKEIPEVKVAYVDPTTMNVTADGRMKPMNVIYADPEYLDIVDLARTQATSANPLLTPRSAVLSDEAARELFGTTDVLGRTIRLQNALDINVAAVLKPIPKHSHMAGRYAAFRPDGIFVSRDTGKALYTAVTGRPWRELSLAQQWFITFSSATYVLLPEDGSLSAAELESRLIGISERNGVLPDIKNEFKVTPLGSAWLESLDMNLFNGSTELSITTLLMALALTTLGVACANFATLAFAQATSQAKEVGLRKTIGASRSQVISQTVIEAALQTVAALALALVLVAIIGQWIETQADLPLLNSIVQSYGFWLAVAMLALVVACSIALYPTAVLSRVRPAQALRANAKQTMSSAGIRILLGVQFIATSGLVVVLTIVYQQNSSAQNRALQSDDDIVASLGFAYRLGGAGFETWRTELSRSPAIRNVSSSTHRPWDFPFSGILPLQSAQGGLVSPNRTGVGYDFEKVLGLTVVAGRTFDKRFADMEQASKGSLSVMVDETLAKQLGFANPTDAVGQSVRLGGRFASDPPVTVVGVVADKPFRLQPLLNFVGTVYVPESSAGVPIVRIDKSRVAEGIRAIEDTWKKLNPSQPVEYDFADDTFARAYAIYKLIGTVLAAICAIALTIAVMGAFGFALFIANRRAHEIGVRKTLGASVGRIVTMLLRDFSKPVLIANLLGWPLAYVAAQKYLSTFEQRIDITLWPFAFGLVFTLATSWIAVGGRAWRTAQVRPADVLRHE